VKNGELSEVKWRLRWNVLSWT